jgi:GH43 family beta-xylosidase
MKSILHLLLQIIRKLLKALFFILLVFGMSLLVCAQKNKSANPVEGTWKYTRQSATNDFRHVLDITPVKEYSSEYFIFDKNNKFRHEFLNENGIIVKTLKGNWKTSGDKIRIVYTDIKYSLNVDYFFLDKDLVLGQNFNHVIFTKNNMADERIALK